MQKMVFGYARVSTSAQKLQMQIDALEAYGIDTKNIFTDVASGAKSDRPGLSELLMKLREGDTVVVWKSCRLARSLKHMITLMENFNSLKIEFKSIQEPFLDTKSANGRFIFNLFSALNEMDREINRERVITGLESARKRGKVGGRPKGLSKRLRDISPGVASMWKDPTVSINDIKRTFNIAQASVYKCLKHQGINIHSMDHKNKVKQSN